MKAISEKSRAVAAVLCFVLGVLGVHRFYVGKIGTGVLMIIFTITGFGLFISGIWALIDFVVIVTGQFEDKGRAVLSNWGD